MHAHGTSGTASTKASQGPTPQLALQVASEDAASLLDVEAAVNRHEDEVASIIARCTLVHAEDIDRARREGFQHRSYTFVCSECHRPVDHVKNATYKSGRIRKTFWRHRTASSCIGASSDNSYLLATYLLQHHAPRVCVRVTKVTTTDDAPPARPLVVPMGAAAPPRVHVRYETARRRYYSCLVISTPAPVDGDHPNRQTDHVLHVIHEDGRHNQGGVVVSYGGPTNDVLSWTGLRVTDIMRTLMEEPWWAAEGTLREEANNILLCGTPVPGPGPPPPSSSSPVPPTVVPTTQRVEDLLVRQAALREQVLTRHREALRESLANGQALSLQAVDWVPMDVERKDFDGVEFFDEVDGRDASAFFCIDVYGVDAKRNQHVLRITGFRPHFFVCVPLDPHRAGSAKLTIGRMMDCLLERVHEDDSPETRRTTMRSPFYEGNVAVEDCRFELRSKFHGFQFDRQTRFLRLAFHSEQARRRAQRAIRKGISVPTTYFGRSFMAFDTYDGAMPPLLQFFHEADIDPSGWVQVPKGQYSRHPEAGRHRTDVSSTANARYVSTTTDGKGVGPLVMCSYDIECNSSHGDFPLAKKTYGALAGELVAYCSHVLLEGTVMLTPSHIMRTLRQVFEGPAGERVCDGRLSTVTTKGDRRPDEKALMDVAVCTKRLITRATTEEWYEGDQVRFKVGTPPRPKQAAISWIDPDNGSFVIAGQRTRGYARADDAANASPVGIHVERVGGIRRFEEMTPPEWRRRKDAVAKTLAETMGVKLPAIEGDRVIQIGSVFWRYGEEAPYKRHVVALDTCDDIDGATVVCCTKEADVLHEWAKLIRCERPNLLVGYNIFGFDNKFMWERADELGCLRAFGNLSSIGAHYATTGEHCVHASHASRWDHTCDPRDQKRNMRGQLVCKCRTGRSKLLRKDLNSAGMGDNTLYFMDIPGMVQIDCMKAVMRDYKLDSYKLDAVSAEFLCGVAVRVRGATTTTSEGEGGGVPPPPPPECTFRTADAYGMKLRDYVQLQVRSVAGFDPLGPKMRVVALRDDTTGDAVRVGRGATLVSLEQTEAARAVFDAWPDGAEYQWGLVKDDVSPAQIFEYQRGTSQQRALVAQYCLNDCELVLLILNKLKLITNNVAMASIACVPLSFLFLRGQGVKGHSLVGRTCHHDRVSIQDKEVDRSAEADDDDEHERTIESYEGAIVIKPEPCIHDKQPIVVLDFASLYPSSQIADNLSPETQILDPAYLGDAGAERLRAEGFEWRDVTYDNIICTRRGKTVKRTKSTTDPEVCCRFVQPTPDGRRRGIIPKICTHLLTERKRVKNLMKAEKDPFAYMLLDGQQLALKISVNSIYGLLGGSTSAIHCKDVAASTTAHGRARLIQAKSFVEDNFEGSRIVYGDTDSIFIRFDIRDEHGVPVEGKAALPLAIALGEKASRDFNAVVAPPHNLEYEKTFYPYIILSPKRYAGNKYEHDPTKCKLSYMGIALKRRDNARIVKDVFAAVLADLLDGRGIDAARRTLLNIVGKLMRGEVPLDKLVITKALRAHYDNPEQQVHKCLAMRVAERNKGNGYRPNDRVPYVYIDVGNRKVQLQGERVEEPAYIEANGLKPDYLFYLTNQICKPIAQIFALVVEQLPGFKYDAGYYDRCRETARAKNPQWDDDRVETKITDMRCAYAGDLLFSSFIRKVENERSGSRPLTEWFRSKPKSTKLKPSTPPRAPQRRRRSGPPQN